MKIPPQSSNLFSEAKTIPQDACPTKFTKRGFIRLFSLGYSSSFPLPTVPMVASYSGSEMPAGLRGIVESKESNVAHGGVEVEPMAHIEEAKKVTSRGLVSEDEKDVNVEERIDKEFHRGGFESDSDVMETVSASTSESN
ncbi:hypothetical protein L1049_014895 [Liquidambar formosana]|uniref:Uncharacterized protein n=1 Tax=Liquidambar formosana TaxID=63359 RepID=A0AAP0RX93_LIQFO